MSQEKIDHLIINSPFEEPKLHWHYDRQTRSFEKRQGRRPAGYVTATPESKSFDDPGIFVPLPLVNQIRPRVKTWRENNYPGVTGITKRLLEHWHERSRNYDTTRHFGKDFKARVAIEAIKGEKLSMR